MSLALLECDERFETGDAFTDEWRFGPATQTNEFICWVLNRFKGYRKTFTTSFGMEGCALIDMFARRSKPMEIVYLDTGFFFPETHVLIERMKEHYPHIDFVNRGAELGVEEQEKTHGPELWKTDPDRCCHLRKVRPLAKVLEPSDLWITSIRRTQSPSRGTTELLDWDPRFEVLKVNPLAYWERDEVWQYIRENDVPYNELHEKGYPTIGCTHCTRSVEGYGPSEYTRLGRWSDSEKTECGLHLVTTP